MIQEKKRNSLAIVLAAGEGTRMKTQLPKILHKVAGLSLIGHILKTLKSINCSDCAVITGHAHEEISKEVNFHFSNAKIFYQAKRLGTAHAVLSAKELLKNGYDDVFILFGDTPLISPNILNQAREKLEKNVDILVSGFYSENPKGYGRLIIDESGLTAIVEEKDADVQQKKIKFCNGGFMAISGKIILPLLEKIDNNNAKKEFYLTDIVAVAKGQNLNIQTLEVPEHSILGANTCLELSEIEKIWQKQKRQEMLLKGVVMEDPDSVYLHFDTKIESDVILEPHIYFGKNVYIESKAQIRAYSYIEDSHIKSFSQIGPFARLRPRTIVGENAKIGNFCEIKNTTIETNAKINHLSYIGDSLVEKAANIGAGAITCNYDGLKKWKTKIGEKAFIGSNTSLVAPLEVGENAYIASGSVITKNVPKNTLAFGRARQVNKLDYKKNKNTK